MRHFLIPYAAAFALAIPPGGQTPRTHRLEATPSTVAYGYYWAHARPVLRIASGVHLLFRQTLNTACSTKKRRSSTS